VKSGVESFYKHLPLLNMRSVLGYRTVWYTSANHVDAGVIWIQAASQFGGRHNMFACLHNLHFSQLIMGLRAVSQTKRICCADFG
jgi:hypothetical protein